jgi:exonuclease III
MSYIILRGRRCVIIVLNVHAPTENTIDKKDRFYEGLQSVFDKFTKYNMNILLGEFNTKVGTEDILKLTNRNNSLLETSNNNELE